MAITASDMKRKSVRASQAIITLLFVLACVSVFLPLVLTVIVSFSSEMSVMQKGYSFFPNEWSTAAYEYVFKETNVLQSYWVTIRVTVIGTTLSVLMCSATGYVLSRKCVKYRNVIAFMFYFPTLLNPGVVAWYYNVKYVFNLDNTIWVLILPSLVSVYNIFLVRNYYSSIPDSLEESAKIDGAAPLTIFFKVMFPLALPITATITLFISLGFWNDWYMASWFIDARHKELYPLQYHLYKLWQTMVTEGNTSEVPQQTVYVATMFVTMGPIILVYPFLQKYFMKGIMVGAVKG